MNKQKIAAIALIYAVACGGWLLLGMTTDMRSTEYQGRLGQAVENLWGAPLVQSAPSFAVAIPGTDRARWLIPSQNEIAVDIQTDYRKKGLIWYPTYVCNFRGKYSLTNEDEVAQKVRMHFDFPPASKTFDAFSFLVDGKPYSGSINPAEGIAEIVEIAPGATAQFDLAYQTRGMREWRYKPDRHAGRVKNLNLMVSTNFADVDYGEGCLSPTQVETTPDGRTAMTWQAADLLTKEDVSVLIPELLNPGPLTSRITFFAPVCLLFFFVLVATINILYRVHIHPMHYLFVAAGFFSFHLLLAYMAGLINIHLAFVISAIVSVGLVTTYLSGALHRAFPWQMAAAGQLFFLVLFSYSFFFEGITGLTVAIGAVITLAVLMKATTRVDWHEVFSSGYGESTQQARADVPAANAETATE